MKTIPSQIACIFFLSLFLVFAFAGSPGYCSMPTVDPYVDVYLPDGVQDYTQMITGDLKVDTPNYIFKFNCGRGVATELSIRNTGFGDYQVFDSAGPGCHVF